MWVGNCRECGSIPGAEDHSPFCSRAEQPKECAPCGGTGVEPDQSAGPCPKCRGKGEVGGALAAYEAAIEAAVEAVTKAVAPKKTRAKKRAKKQR